MKRGIKLPDNPSEWGFKGENYLLVIGIDKYTHWKPLNNAVKDIRDLSRVLTDRYQFEPDQVRTLIDDEATEDNIRRVLLEVRKSITPEDNLVVYYSGHGHYDSDLEEGYWVPANARKDSPSDYISNSDVLKWIRAIKTHHTLVLVDSCFSGTLVSQSRSEVLSEKYPSSRIFASGRKELVDDGTPGINSPFAKALLSRLSYNSDRVLRTSELIQAVTRTVEAEAGQAPIEGRIKDAGDQGGEFVFHLKVTEDEIWTSVVDANSATEYAKYIEYFPDGKYVLEARTKLSSLTDETDWKRALELSTPASLASYLESHPRGSHFEEAFHKLEELEENESWQTARMRNTVSAYMDYLRKYPSGRFSALAKKHLEGLKGALEKGEQELMDDELEGIADISAKASDTKSRYKALLNEAEGLFAQMSYTDCIARYRSALELYEAHFVPDRRFIEHRITEAEKRVTYNELVEDGRQAVTDGNYELALQFFRKARTLDDSLKIREWISHAEKKLKGEPESQKPVFKPQPASQQKKKGSLAWIAWVAGFVVIGVVCIVIWAVVSSAADMENAYDYLTTSEIQPVDPNADASQSHTSGNEQSQYAQDLQFIDIIPGTWNVTDMLIGEVSIQTLEGILPPSAFEFRSDGNLTYWLSGISYGGTWYIEGKFAQFQSQIAIPDAQMGGYISELGEEYMVIQLTDGLQSITNYLRKQ